MVKYSIVMDWLLVWLSVTAKMAGLLSSVISTPAIEILGRPSSSRMAPAATPSSTVALVGWPSWIWKVSSGLRDVVLEGLHVDAGQQSCPTGR